MLLTAKDIKNGLEGYSNPACKLQRMASDGTYHQVIRGLYETDPSTPAMYLAGSICTPSYLSFEYALSYHGWMAFGEDRITSATTGKRHIKTFDTSFGRFEYRDVPGNVFHRGVVMHEENGYAISMAEPEKALCDLLYIMKPERSMKKLADTLFEDIGVFEDSVRGMDTSLFEDLAGRYRCTNIRVLADHLKILL